VFFDDYWRYVRDHNIIDEIDFDEELKELDEKYFYNFIEGYIQGIINS
jgi:hypothetical protein